MGLKIVEVNTRGDLKKFIDFQFDHYSADPNWVPPIKKDEYKALSPKANPAFEFCDARFWMVLDGHKPIGRIGGIINHPYNDKVGGKFGRINRIEFIDDEKVFDLLIQTVSEWFGTQGMTKIHGPLGFSNLDTQGLLLEGFNTLPSIASVHHWPYYQRHFDRLGFSKENDWVEFKLTLNEQAVSKAERGLELVKRRYGYTSMEQMSKTEMKQYAPRIFEILNRAFAELPYVAELNERMIQLYIKKYFDILDPRFITMVKKEDELIGFFIGLPNLSMAMKKARGKLFPFGFTHVLKALKKPKVIDMLLTGVLPEHQSNGVAVILIGELQRRMLNLGIDRLETTGVFESNQAVISNWKNYEHELHRRRRCYVKEIK